MTPKEKASQLFEAYRKQFVQITDKHKRKYRTKQCALIAVDEILKNGNIDSHLLKHDKLMIDVHYWKEVKNEIENI